MPITSPVFSPIASAIICPFGFGSCDTTIIQEGALQGELELELG